MGARLRTIPELSIMKYRLTPLQLPAIYFFGRGLLIFYEHSKLDNYDKLELGAIEPFLLFGLTLGILIVDLTIQFAVGLTVKTRPKRIIYITEFVIIVFGLLWVWKTFYPTIHI